MQSLAEHLRRCGCIVADLDGLTIEASPPPRSLDAGIADLEVQAYVTVWRELNPEVEVVLIAAADRVAPTMSSTSVNPRAERQDRLELVSGVRTTAGS